MTALTAIPADLRASIANLTHGDKVRVDFTHRPSIVGTLRRSGSFVLTEVMPNALFLDVYGSPLIRTQDGNPGACVTSVELFNQDEWLDLCAEFAQDWAQKTFAAEHCPKSEQGWRQLAAEEARAAFLAECKRGESA
jgi:hypothetical protein